MKLQKGFTLVEIMIVVVIIAILASVAIPGYQDYVIRGKLTEATSTLSDGRVKMEQFYQDNRTYNGGVCPAASTYFTYTCGDFSDSSYTITATGKSDLSSFVYTINQSNLKQTTGLKPGWGTPPMNCWVTSKGGTC